MSVSTVPGASALTRMPFSAKTAAIERVIAISPAFAAAYIAVLAEKRKAPADTTFRTAALPDASRCGSARSTRKTGPAQVGAQRLLPRVDREMAEGQGQRVRRIVDDDVQPAELVDGPVDEGVDGVDVAHVRRHADGLAALGPQVRFHRRAGVGLAARDRDLRSGRQQALGDGVADPPRAAGDDRDSARQVVQRAEFGAVHVRLLGRCAHRGAGAMRNVVTLAT